MQVIIVGHHSRSEWIGKLQRSLLASACIMDCANEGALAGHRKALEIAATIDDRCIIMEDDAIPVEGFYDLAGDWLYSYENEMISFYLGTSRPPQWQSRVDKELEHAPLGFIRLPTLIHGVCYSIPHNAIERVLKNMQGPEADFAVGHGWGRSVLYPVESLVEHRDGPIVERHPDGQPRDQPRVARSLAAPLMFDR